MASIRRADPPLQDSVFKMFDMTGKVTIITGGSGGIGYEVARALAEAGSNVALWYHSSSTAQKQAETIENDFKVKCRAYQCDVSNFDQVSAVVDTVVKDFGKLDVMVANAGKPSRAAGLDDKLEDYHRIVDIDLHGAFYCARAAGEIFRKQGSGNLIFTGSMSGHIANVPQLQACYNACKAGVIHLAKSLAVEWAGFARVNCVSPGYINTPISDDCPSSLKEEWYKRTPMQRDADPRELKGVYLYLASDASTFTTGSDIIVDGGYTCI
ncbi:Sorbose reductase [Pestalotiopsis fici W106-1]|uniref:Sorbose reductase n=1 Tax=Pestalotiopsis fici (strain W106-1 / CGMCC3.15140) TaxID=1229662 RepID=W3X2S6_PESFW|nr:Sorbose reductase [Pestalotiopsis fici W106-1]ETS80443.1 Sorbose reductase [Pestalotiopsis fici W106-1]